MGFYPFDLSIPHVTYTCLGGFVVVFGMFSLLIREKLYIGESIWAFVFGIIIGPYGANIFSPRDWANRDRHVINIITLEFTRVVLAIGVFAIGVELPKAYMRKHWKSLLFLLGPVMTYGWFVSAALVYALIPGLNFLSSLVVAAALTPTDPILAAAVVGGKYAEKHVPEHLRHLLAAESGCNDGAAFPFLFIALYLILEEKDSTAIAHWFYVTWLYEIALGMVLGALIGFAFRHLMKFCERKELIDRKSYVAQYISLALFSDGVTTILGSDDLLAAFSSGTAFAWDGFFNRQTEESAFSSVIDLLLNIATFIFLGAWMPFSDFSNESLTLSPWRLVVLGILVLVLRRLPAMILLYRWIPDVKTFKEALFSGHFGPMGVGAIFIATLAVKKLPDAHDPPQGQVELLAASLQPIVSFMVLVSILIHGLSIPFFSLGRRVHSVSRTWSRHQSMDTRPEWATHTRHITRPEDVVVNRDKDAIAVTETEKVVDTSSGTRTPPDAAERAPVPTPEKTEVETTREWKEGPHLVIEHCPKNPGDDVEVEIIRNAFVGDEENQMVAALHNAEHQVQEEVHKVLERIHSITSSIHSNSSKQKAKRPEKEREEDWKDEDAEGSAKSSSSDSQPAPADDQERPKSSKRKFLKPAVFIQSRSTGRRRESLKRGLFGHRPVKPSSLQTSNLSGAEAKESEVDEEERRGRPRVVIAHSPSPASSLGEGPSRPVPPAISPRASQLRYRLGRGESTSESHGRDASPARSIRFMDERAERVAATPRGVLTPAANSIEDLPLQAVSTSQTQSPTDPSSPTSEPKVTFDVPRSKTR